MNWGLWILLGALAYIAIGIFVGTIAEFKGESRDDEDRAWFTWGWPIFLGLAGGYVLGYLPIWCVKNAPRLTSACRRKLRKEHIHELLRRNCPMCLDSPTIDNLLHAHLRNQLQEGRLYGEINRITNRGPAGRQPVSPEAAQYGPQAAG